MLTQQFCDQQRDDSQKMPRHHFNSAEEFSASPSPTHANAEAELRNAEAELRERRAEEVRQQLQLPRPQPTRHVDDLLNLATEQYEAVIEADEKGELAWEEAKKAWDKAWEEAKKAEALRQTEAAAAKKHTLAALLSAQEHQRMQQDKDAQAASAGAAAHLLPVP
jgi:hypothetical protein